MLSNRKYRRGLIAAKKPVNVTLNCTEGVVVSELTMSPLSDKPYFASINSILGFMSRHELFDILIISGLPLSKATQIKTFFDRNADLKTMVFSVNVKSLNLLFFGQYKALIDLDTFLDTLKAYYKDYFSVKYVIDKKIAYVIVEKN